jgi:hypothetical protein
MTPGRDGYQSTNIPNTNERIPESHESLTDSNVRGLGALSPGARAATAETNLDKPGQDEFNLIGKCSNTGITGTVMVCGLQVLFGELAKLIRNGPG